MLNTVRFMEEFIKLQIIKEFGAKMVLMENKYLTPLENDNCVLSMCNLEDHEKIKKFALTQIRYLNEIERKIEVYNLMGIISLFNDGRIIIIDYESR